MIVRPLSVNENDLTFYQAQLNSYHLLGETRQSINYGIGKRFLSEDGSSFWGLNSFVDADRELNSRLGLGLEFRASNFDLTGNYYLDAIDELNETTLTEEIINKISEEVAVVAIPNIRWTDGYIIDLKKVSNTCKKFDVNLILDLTQSAGAMQIDLKEINPDFAIIANYKWMLGPYSTGFLYISDKFIDGVPLEETWIGRKNSQDFSKLTDYQSLYNSDSIRFDMGQRANFSLLPGVKAALEQLQDLSLIHI